MANKIQDKVEATKSSRTIYLYEIPKELSTDITSVGLIQLTAGEEMQAAKRSGSDPIRLVYEQVKQCLVEVNGEHVSLADGTADAAFDRMPPMIRNLVMTAYGQLHTPPEEATSGFLKSRSIRVA